MQQTEKTKPVRLVCINCHTELYGWRVGQEAVEIKCSKCGADTISKVMSRRHVQVDIFAPKGQVLLE